MASYQCTPDYQASFLFEVEIFIKIPYAFFLRRGLLVLGTFHGVVYPLEIGWLAMQGGKCSIYAVTIDQSNVLVGKCGADGVSLPGQKVPSPLRGELAYLKNMEAAASSDSSSPNDLPCSLGGTAR